MIEWIKKTIQLHRNYLMFLLFTWGLFFGYLFSKMIIFRKEGLYLGHPNVWSDWTLHISLANIFAHKPVEYWFSYHPLFANGKLTYPFLMDFISGVFLRAGSSLDLAFFLPSLFFSILLIFSMYSLFYIISRSKSASVIAIFIYFLSSGLGFIKFLSEFISHPDLNIFLHPLIEYSRLNNYDWYTGNVIVGLILPQRSFLMGLSIGLTSLALLFYALTKNKLENKKSKKILILSGILAGVLPIAHPHTFLVMVIIGGVTVLVNIKNLSKLIYYIIPAGIISIILSLLFLKGGIQTNSYINFLPGWNSKGLLDFIYLWITVWGIALPLAIISFLKIIGKTPNTIKVFFVSFFIVFALANLILFQPIRWDNTKIFWWVYVGLSLLCSMALIRMFRLNLIYKIFAIFFFVILIFTGILEINRLLDFDRNTYLITSTSDINLGVQIRNNTNYNDLFLTAPKHNNLVMMWGERPILLGYTAWVLNFGFNYQQIEKDVYSMYQGGYYARNLLKMYKIKYVLIGPSELTELRANENYFRDNFYLAFYNENNRIYKIK